MKSKTTKTLHITTAFILVFTMSIGLLGASNYVGYDSKTNLDMQSRGNSAPTNNTTLPYRGMDQM